ncbi:MAG: ATP-binding protein [Leptolyngbyaceae cyanobacterium MO_188.B28]|nr:ATP-binding protein [Leptolyngbyaceae cyanobacterium MO_188.B28]
MTAMQLSKLTTQDLNWGKAIDRNVLIVRPETALLEVIEKMDQTQASCAFIVEADQLMGMFTEGDVVKLAAAGAKFSEIEVDAVMTRNVKPLLQLGGESLLTALTLLNQHCIRHLPVVGQQGQLLGVITPASICQFLETFPQQSVSPRQLRSPLEHLNGDLTQMNAPIDAQSWENHGGFWVAPENLIQTISEGENGQTFLHQTNTELQAILKALPDAVVVLDEAGQIQRVNQAFLQLFGYADDELLGRSTRLLYVTVEDYETQERRRDNLNLQGPLKSYEMHYLRRNGDQVVSETTEAPLKDDQGRIIGCLMLIRDISDLKQAEADLKQYRERLKLRVISRTAELTQANQLLQREINERQQIAAFLKDQAELEKLISDISNQFINLPLDGVDQGIESALQSICEFMKADRGHVILNSDSGKTDCGLYVWSAPGIDAPQQNLQAGLLSGGGPWIDWQLEQFGVARISSMADLPRDASAEKALCQRDGVQSLVVVRMVYGGTLMGLLSIESLQREKDWSAKDITRLRLIAETFASALKHCRSQGALVERTRELERSNADLEQFAYVASHDLQEPLRAVTSYAQLLSRRYAGKLDAKANKYIGYIVDGGNRMQQLIQDLLNYSRVGTRGKAFQSVQVDKAISQALTNLAISIRQSGARVTVDSLPTVMADESQLSQLLQNLIGNAIKFRGEDCPQIYISAVRQKDGEWLTVNGAIVPDLSPLSHPCVRMQWLFFVRDNGIGIEPNYAERIFTLFQRLHTRRQYPGTGIGLAICKKIVERHGGQIWVESELGVGSTFYFTIPMSSPLSSPFQ